MAKAKTIKKKKKVNEGLAFAVEAAKIARDRNCTDIVAIDLRGKSNAADFFVIATSTSPRQARTVIDYVQEYAHSLGRSRFGVAGYEQGRWILADYVDVVVHVFDKEYREYYELENLWGDAPRVEIE